MLKDMRVCACVCVCVCVAVCAVKKFSRRYLVSRSGSAGVFFVIFGRNSGPVRAQKQQFCSSKKHLAGICEHSCKKYSFCDRFLGQIPAK